MRVRVRDAAAADRATITGWNLALADETEDKGLDAAILEEGVRCVLEDPSLGRYFIAEIDGRAVGQMMLTREWSDWRNGLFWWIQSVYVAPDARRAGVFTALYRHVEALARADATVCGLRLYVHDSNTRAVDTYRRLGMRDGHYRVMEVELPPAAAQ